MHGPRRMLTPGQIASGSPERMQAVLNGDFHIHTPLWFYVLKEAEMLGARGPWRPAGRGEPRPLGTHLVANMILGLIISDPGSYWNAPGGPWSPDNFRPGDPIDSLEDLARFCGLI